MGIILYYLRPIVYFRPITILLKNLKLIYINRLNLLIIALLKGVLPITLPTVLVLLNMISNVRLALFAIVLYIFEII